MIINVSMIIEVLPSASSGIHIIILHNIATARMS